MQPGVERLGERVEAARSPAQAVDGAEVIVTAAPIVQDPDPPLLPDLLGARFLVLPIDFDAIVRPEVIERADLFAVDDVGQFEYYRELGHFRGWPAPAANVGAALAFDGAPARVACCNLGIGALDAAFAKVVLDRARAEAAGTELPL